MTLLMDTQTMIGGNISSQAATNSKVCSFWSKCAIHITPFRPLDGSNMSEKNAKAIKDLQKKPYNKLCFDCGQKVRRVSHLCFLACAVFRYQGGARWPVAAITAAGCIFSAFGP